MAKSADYEPQNIRLKLKIQKQEGNPGDKQKYESNEISENSASIFYILT